MENIMGFTGNGITINSGNQDFSVVASLGNVTITPRSTALPQFVQIARCWTVSLSAIHEVRIVEIRKGENAVSIHLAHKKDSFILTGKEGKQFLEVYGKLFFEDKVIGEVLNQQPL